jgi:hypothetical protein
VDGVTGHTKTELRAEVLMTRRTLPPQLHDAEAFALCGHLPDFIGGGETVCAYVPVGSEPGSASLIDSLLSRGRQGRGTAGPRRGLLRSLAAAGRSDGATGGRGPR